MTRMGGNERNTGMRRCNLMGSAALIMTSLFAAPTWAQDGGSEDPAASDADVSIVVTGSRIKRTGFEEQVPATVISAERIENLGQVNVSEVLTSIPQNAAFQSDTNAGPGVGSRNSSNIGANYANLRGLNPYYGTRTLTLVDSRRFVPTSDSGAVDVNLIPSALIARVETVTGGASAAYGSDAIAGVVNIILDRKLNGFKSQIDVGTTEKGDGESFHASLGAGTSFGGGRGHIVVSGEYQKNFAVGGCAEVRDWCAESWDVFTNSNVLVNGVLSGYNRPGTPTYGQPNFILGRDSKLAYTTKTGAIRDRAPGAAAARNMQFNAAGDTLIPFDPGLYAQNTTLGPRSGGDGPSIFEDAALRTPITRYALYAAASYDLSDSITATLEASYGQREATATGVVAANASTYFMQPDNAYLSPQAKAIIGNSPFSFGKDLDSDYKSLNTAKAQTFRAIAGLNGKFGVGDWTWDLYYQYGRNTRHQSLSGSRVNSFFLFAIDAVVDPSSGNIVCRAVLQNNPAAAGCLPLNLFGVGNASQEALNYAYRTAMEDFKYEQHVVSAAVQGSLFDGFGAGPVAAALGAEYRSDTGDVTHGNLPYYDDFAGSFGLDYSGKIKVLEGFSELNVPVLRNAPLGNFLEFNGAIRYTRSKASNGVTGETKTIHATSWKVGAVYEPLDLIRFRATRSRDIRAAGFRELFEQQIPTDPTTTRGRVMNPALGGTFDPTPILSGGSFALEPEKADTWTAGAVISPMRNLRFSADWFEITIDGAVTTPSGQQLVDTCYNLNVFCDRITFNPANPTDITFVDARQINVGSFTTRGIDVELDYTMELGAATRMNFRLLGTYLYDLIIEAAPGSTPQNFAGQSGPAAPLGDFNPSPKWILNGTVTLDSGPFTGVLQGRYVGKGALSKALIGPDDPNYDPTLPNSISYNKVPSRFYMTLGLNYRVKPNAGRTQIEFFGVVENLLDKDPPIAPGTTGSVVQSSYPTNPAFFDTLGRRYRVGARVKY
ncbi:MAG: TonB-dependent receptor [Sphingobium sp.]